jgi:hypothetical protein
VLVPIVLRERPMVLLTERATHLSTHSGRSPFPGGKCDDTDVDASTRRCARRTRKSAWSSLAEVLGQMPTYTHRHHVRRHAGDRAGAARLPAGAERPRGGGRLRGAAGLPDEPRHHHRHAIDIGGVRREWFSMPYMDGSTDRFIWGATAAMLRNFYRFLAA